MATFTKFDSFTLELAKGEHDLETDTLKVLLTNTAPVSTNAVRTDITEISAGNGYTAAGETITTTSLTQTGGTTKLVLADEVITASGGSIGPFRYAVVYNDTAASDQLIGYVDYGSSITVADTETFTLDFDASGGAITI